MRVAATHVTAGARFVGAISIVALLAGCAGHPVRATLAAGAANVVAQASPSSQGASPSAAAPPPSLQQIESFGAAGGELSPKEAARVGRVRQAALTYGFQAGLAYTTHLINQIVRAHAEYLTRVYDFGALMIDAPYGTKILPPIIVASKNLYRQIGGNSVIIAHKRYHILAPAAFAPVQPMWQTYLIQPWVKAEQPRHDDFPRNVIERKVWRASLAKGWAEGAAAAYSAFSINNHRLERAFVGMVRWSKLVASGLATKPQVVAVMKPIVGNGVTVTIDKGEVRITRGAELVASGG